MVTVLRLHIQFSSVHQKWFCTDDDYDGAPDACKQCMGEGISEKEAVNDYFDQLEEMRND